MNYAAANALSGAMGAQINAARRPISEEILMLADSLAERAEALAAQADEKLASIMRPMPPSISESLKRDALEEYPPLFDKLRGRLLSIEGSLSRISSAISRTEL